MCGIAGAIDTSAGRAAARVEKLNAAQRHRGPDHSVVITIGGFTLGNTRLAIQDPGPAGNQPFVSADHRYHCVFNGEIYNHRDLVQRYGLRVRTSCDGEIIPALWGKLGVASLAELRGMFAVALVDSLEDRLYLARDPFGIKPLHWRQGPDGLLFASEVGALTHVGGSARIDSEAIARYFRLGALAADQTPFMEITSLPPNSVACFDSNSHVTVGLIQPDGPLAVPAEPGGLARALTESVGLHLGADVPTALLLSAGVDSTAIAATGRRLGRDLHCVTVATKGASDESGVAARTARHYGHLFQRVEASLEEGDVTRFFGAMQRPTIDGLNTYIVCKAVHEAGFKVALSGLGGDEAIGGYSHFRLLRYLPGLRALDRVPGAVHQALAAVATGTSPGSTGKPRRLLASGGPRDAWGLCRLQRELLPETLVSDLTGVIRRPRASSDRALPRRRGSFRALVAAEVALYLQATLLPDADSFSMASSVELRVPFVDVQVFAASLEVARDKARGPGKTAIGVGLRDPYLRQLAAEPKRGFTLPMRHWLAGPLEPLLRAAAEPDAAVWSVVDRMAAERAGLTPFRSVDRWAEAWAFAALNAWLDGGQHTISTSFPGPA